MKVIMITLIVFLTACVPENKYKAKGELYQCFVSGKAIYKSNVAPEQRGGKWFKLGNKVVKVDDCYCMGCIGF